MKKTFLLAFFAIIYLSLLAQSLNVASYNIRLHSKADYKNGDGWTERRDEMCSLIEFSAFDIFGAQEVCHDQLVDMLERLPNYGYVGVARDDGATLGEYSPIFYSKSRFDEWDSGTFWLSETPEKVSYGWDADCRRVCSWAYFYDKISKNKFWFFNTHMDHIGVKARAEGAKLILSKIRQMCGEKDRVILTGDFNVAQGSIPYKTIAESGFMYDSYSLADVKFAPTGTFNNFDIKRNSDKRIDHIFVSGEIDVMRYGILTYHYWSDICNEQNGEKEGEKRTNYVHLPSDHYPVQIIVEF